MKRLDCTGRTELALTQLIVSQLIVTQPIITELTGSELAGSELAAVTSLEMKWNMTACSPRLDSTALIVHLVDQFNRSAR